MRNNQLAPRQIFDMVQSGEVQKEFERVNVLRNVQYEQEVQFSLQALQKSEWLMKAAQSNPHTLRAAVYNIASIGLSLNPATAHAYLVPRDNQVCLDISYRGLKRIATESGAIEWAKAELVYKNDSFVVNGVNAAPTHSFDPFSEDRGDVVGAYCVAKLPSGDYMTEVMSRAELDKIRDTSKAKNGPWKTWPEEMMKKSVIKRASKSWPETKDKERWDNAVRIQNEYDGCAYTLEQERHFHHLIKRGAALELVEFLRDIGEEATIALYNSAPRGEKTKLKDAVNKLNKEAHEILDGLAVELSGYIAQSDLTGALEVVEGVGGLIDMIKVRLSPMDAEALDGIIKEAA